LRGNGSGRGSDTDEECGDLELVKLIHEKIVLSDSREGLGWEIDTKGVKEVRAKHGVGENTVLSELGTLVSVTSLTEEDIARVESGSTTTGRDDRGTETDVEANGFLESARDVEVKVLPEPTAESSLEDTLLRHCHLVVRVLPAVGGTAFAMVFSGGFIVTHSGNEGEVSLRPEGLNDVSGTTIRADLDFSGEERSGNVVGSSDGVSDGELKVNVLNGVHCAGLEEVREMDLTATEARSTHIVEAELRERGVDRDSLPLFCLLNDALTTGGVSEAGGVNEIGYGLRNALTCHDALGRV
jgi:hypothetical protein